MDHGWMSVDEWMDGRMMGWWIGWNRAGLDWPAAGARNGRRHHLEHHPRTSQHLPAALSGSPRPFHINSCYATSPPSCSFLLDSHASTLSATHLKSAQHHIYNLQ